VPTGIRRRGSSFEAWVFDKRSGKKIRKTFQTEAAAKSWRADATGAVRRRELRPPTSSTIGEAWEAWLEGARGGKIRKRKTGEAYKPSLIRNARRSLIGQELCESVPARIDIGRQTAKDERVLLAVPGTMRFRSARG
jgi:integrase